ncbi:PQQ-binding-like beta-propeller repeat protein [Pyrococcus sp. ST04]|uniref:outer membrane protein assembly factor BamB family protein n=1 Tax=Pyrococcus sp. ST04 TaxID=1183377 RepID=UPI0002605AA4|nr:PQQ-binding-like beta-propeller repeat protein [Pyrococcus sp. ST04]AFK22101.1 dehydrogenase [Pyrococcus sp. ST04]
MKKIVLLMILLLVTPVLAWKGTLCENVKYQKSIEAVAIENSTIYASCSYRMLANSSGMIAVYYLGTTGAFSANGTRLWEIDSGFVTKLSTWKDYLLMGSMGGLLKVNSSGNYTGRFLTKYKLYDFVIDGNYAYLASGDVFINYSRGEVAKVNLNTMEKVWSVNLTEMADRVRVGDIVYVGTGYPSGFAGKLRFGSLYGISKNGKILWKVNLEEWVRDLEVWNGMAVVGTGYNNTGHLYVIDADGNVKLNVTLFYVEDITIDGEKAYVAGYKKVAAVDLKSGKVLWEVPLPYRAKVIKEFNGKLLVGTGEFKTKNETVYSVGTLYVLNKENGKIVNEIPTGYVRSLAVGDGEVVIGTGSNELLVLTKEEIVPRSTCGLGVMLLLTLLALIKKLHEG